MHDSCEDEREQNWGWQEDGAEMEEGSRGKKMSKRAREGLRGLGSGVHEVLVFVGCDCVKGRLSLFPSGFNNDNRVMFRKEMMALTMSLSASYGSTLCATGAPSQSRAGSRTENFLGWLPSRK